MLSWMTFCISRNLFLNFTDLTAERTSITVCLTHGLVKYFNLLWRAGKTEIVKTTCMNETTLKVQLACLRIRVVR